MLCALLQINPRVGDVFGNAELIAARALEAAAQGAELALTPELALVGRPALDALLYPALAEEAEAAAQALAARLAAGPALILGSLGRNLSGRGRPLFNQALFLKGGRVEAVYRRRFWPDGPAFGEDAYFEPGAEPGRLDFKGRRWVLTIGEELEAAEAAAGEVLVNLAALPFAAGSYEPRQAKLAGLSRRFGVPLLQANPAGGQDETIFEGRSLALGPDGELLARGPGFAEGTVLVDPDGPASAPPQDDFALEAEWRRALTLGLKDYCAKTGFGRTVLGLSGGVDSALTAALAVGALGPDKVSGLLMPSPYSSGHSLSDALALAENLKIKTETLPIAPVMKAYEGLLAAPFAGLAPDTAEENLQARIRGALLMALANKFGALLLCTGNKSEVAVGYCTIYGDMCGGLAVIGDLYKTEVFRLGHWLNAEQGKEVIPRNVLLKAPSAELRPGQTDQDSLPPYEELDPILRKLLDERRTPAELAAAGWDEDVVFKVAALVKASEFKRRQGAPTLKVSAGAFGPGWNLPLAGRSVFDRPTEANR